MITNKPSPNRSIFRAELQKIRAEIGSMNTGRELKLDAIDSNVKLIQHACEKPSSQENLKNLCYSLEMSTSGILEVSKKIEIIRSLAFSSMGERNLKIVDANTKTFGWVFRSDELPSADVRSHIKLKRWLTSENGIFWVSGKAGSGKSTLMKWLYHDARTKACLETWAQGAELVCARCYFWNAGTEMQKSQQGLLQSLLHEILSKCPDLIPTVCKERWNVKKLSRAHGAPWTYAEVKAAFDRLQEVSPTNKKFCFFIDGLDEYDEHGRDHLDLIDSMLAMARSSHIKICLSSRPWNCFEDAFGSDTQRKLYLQHLTREDIEIYARDKLTIPKCYLETEGDQIFHQQLILEIVDRAQGVFLWVYLVIRSLREGILSGDDMYMLQIRLRSLPTDLELFFEHILKSVDPIYKAKVGSIFQVALETDEPLLLILYSFIDDDDPEFAMKLPIAALTPGEILTRQRTMQRRINGRTKGLLEVNGAVKEKADPLQKVDFLHRTVRDFLMAKRTNAILKEMAPPPFNACRALSRAFLAGLKTKVLPVDDLSRTTRMARRVEDCVNTADGAMLQGLEDFCKIHPLIFLDTHTLFLEYAVSEGLVCYAESQLDEHPDIIFAKGSALLAAAMRIHQFGSFPKTNLRPMVEMLLRRGANPNGMIGGRPAWASIFQLFPPKYAETAEFDNWFVLFKMLLLNGGNAQDAVPLLERSGSWWSLDKPNSFEEESRMFQVVATLLCHGLDPNKPIREKCTLWSELLEWPYRRSDDGEVEISLLRIIAMFLRYGADPMILDCVSRTGVYVKSDKVQLERHHSTPGTYLLCYMSSTLEGNDEMNEFIQLLEQEKSYRVRQNPDPEVRAKRHKDGFQGSSKRTRR
jgi:hypothetical protein